MAVTTSKNRNSRTLKNPFHQIPKLSRSYLFFEVYRGPRKMEKYSFNDLRPPCYTYI